MKLADTFSSVMRAALVLTPGKPFIDWINSIDPDNGRLINKIEPDVYLLPDYETNEEMESWLSRNFDWLFCEQLNNWYLDETLWPGKRTFKLFNEWFSYSLHPMVWDSVEGPIEKLD